jgi:hypothetical protein
MKTMIRKSVIVTAALAGVALAGATPASAEPPNGSYTATVTQGGGGVRGGRTTTIFFTPCGPDCANMRVEGTGAAGDLHQQGGAWVGSLTAENGDVCAQTLDSSLVMTSECPAHRLVMQLTKNG